MFEFDTQVAPLWFRDGDIQIRARRFDNGDVRCYRLHRDLLAVHAPLFVQFLDDALERECTDDTDDEQFVFLPEDVKLVEWFLYALLHPASLLRWKYKSMSFKSAVQLYKMASKYKVDYITDVLTAQLEQDWPKNIWEWDAFESDDELCIRRMNVYHRTMYPEPAAAIEFARVANLPSILPAAFYQLSRVSAGNDFDTNFKMGCSWKWGTRSARWSDISKEDLMRLAWGKEQLSNYVGFIQRGLTEAIPVEETKCRAAWKLSTLKSDDILHDLQEICKPDKLPGAFMCEACRLEVNKMARKERRWTWELLPHLFRLPTHVSAGSPLSLPHLQ